MVIRYASLSIFDYFTKNEKEAYKVTSLSVCVSPFFKGKLAKNMAITQVFLLHRSKWQRIVQSDVIGDHYLHGAIANVSGCFTLPRPSLSVTLSFSKSL
jgi:hypothetical protein